MRRSVLASLLVSSSVVLADVDCGGGASCPSGNTCCRNGSGGFSCCPVVDASCCPDYVHCCPPEHPVCDLSTGSCTARSMQSMLAGKVSRVPWLTKTPAANRETAAAERKEEKKAREDQEAARRRLKRATEFWGSGSEQELEIIIARTTTVVKKNTIGTMGTGGGWCAHAPLGSHRTRTHSGGARGARARTGGRSGARQEEDAAARGRSRQGGE